MNPIITTIVIKSNECINEKLIDSPIQSHLIVNRMIECTNKAKKAYKMELSNMTQ